MRERVTVAAAAAACATVEHVRLSPEAQIAERVVNCCLAEATGALQSFLSNLWQQLQLQER